MHITHVYRWMRDIKGTERVGQVQFSAFNCEDMSVLVFYANEGVCRGVVQSMRSEGQKFDINTKVKLCLKVHRSTTILQPGGWDNYTHTVNILGRIKYCVYNGLNVCHLILYCHKIAVDNLVYLLSVTNLSKCIHAHRQVLLNFLLCVNKRISVNYRALMLIL